MKINQYALASVLIVSLAACGGGDGDGDIATTAPEAKPPVSGNNSGTPTPPTSNTDSPSNGNNTDPSDHTGTAPKVTGSLPETYEDVSHLASSAKLHSNVYMAYANSLPEGAIDLQQQTITLPANDSRKYQVGDVLVSDYQDVFYGKINRITPYGDNIVYSYEEATLVDVFEELNLALGEEQMKFSLPPELNQYITDSTTGQAIRIRNENYTSALDNDSVTARQNEPLMRYSAQLNDDAFTINLKGMGLHAQYPQIDGDFNFDLNAKSTEISVGLGKLVIDYEASPKLSAYYRVIYGMKGQFKEVEFLKKEFKTRPIKILVYGVPIILHAEFNLSGVLDGDIGSTTAFTAKYDGQGYFKLKTEGTNVLESDFNFKNAEYPLPHIPRPNELFPSFNSGENNTNIKTSLTSMIVVNYMAGAYLKKSLPISFTSKYSMVPIYESPYSVQYNTKLDLHLDLGLDVPADIKKYFAKNEFKIFGIKLFPDLSFFPRSIASKEYSVYDSSSSLYQNNLLKITSSSSNKHDIYFTLDGQRYSVDHWNNTEWISRPLNPGLHRIDFVKGSQCYGTEEQCENNPSSYVRLDPTGFSMVSYQNNQNNLYQNVTLRFDDTKNTATVYFYVPDMADPHDYYLNLYKK